jgi:hypothetical protein
MPNGLPDIWWWFDGSLNRWIQFVNPPAGLNGC